MAITFKVTIPTGSLLEQELRDKTGRQRTLHMYLLGELGVRTLKNIGGADKIADVCEQIPTEKIKLKTGNGEVKPLSNKEIVVFDVGDLLSA